MPFDALIATLVLAGGGPTFLPPADSTMYILRRATDTVGVEVVARSAASAAGGS